MSNLSFMEAFFKNKKKPQQNNVIKKHLLKRLLGLKQFNFNNFHLHEIKYKFCVDERPACKNNCTPSTFQN